MKHAAATLLITTLSAGCLASTVPTDDLVVTPTRIAFTADGTLLVGGYGERIDNIPENSAEPRGDFFVARLNGDSVTADRWVGTPGPERLRAVRPTPDGGMLAVGASLVSACEDSAWHQRGALVETSESGSVVRALTLSRTSTTAIGQCEFPERFDIAWAGKSADRTVIVGDWATYETATSEDGLTVASLDDGLHWAVRYDGRATLRGVAVVGEATYVAIETGARTVLTRFDDAGETEWAVELDWTGVRLTAKSTGVSIAGLCASGEVCVGQLSSSGEVGASLRIDELEAETIELVDANTVAAWDRTKIFYLSFGEPLALSEARFVESTDRPMALSGESVASIIDGEVDVWSLGDECKRPSYDIEELATSDAGLMVMSLSAPWVDEQLTLAEWSVVPEPRGRELPATDCR